MVTSAFTRGIRRDVRRLFTDTASIKRKTSESLNTTTGVTSPVYTVLYADVACRVRPSTTRNVDTGEETVEVGVVVVVVPWDIEDVQPDDIIDITSGDPDLNGRSLTVSAIAVASHAGFRQLTARFRLEG